MSKRESTDIRKKQISQAAQKIILENGLNKFTTSAIAKEVGISEGALFKHIKNKEEIVFLVISEMENILFTDFPPEHEDPLKRLGLFFNQRTKLLKKAPMAIRLFFSEQLLQIAGEKGKEKIRNMKNRSVEFVKSCIEEANEKKLLKQGIDISHVILFFFGSIMAAVNLHPPFDFPTEHSRFNIDINNLWQTIETLLRR